MKNFKLNWKAYFSAVFILFLAAVMIWGLTRLFSPDFTSEDDLDGGLRITFIILSAFLALEFLETGLMIIYIIIRQNGAFTLTDTGIEQTFVILMFGPVMICLPVRLIAWSAVNKIELKDGEPIARLNENSLDQVKTCRFAKFLMKLNGYPFPCKWTAESAEEIKSCSENFMEKHAKKTETD